MNKAVLRRCGLLSALLCAVALAGAVETSAPAAASQTRVQDEKQRFGERMKAERQAFEQKQSEERKAFRASLQGKTVDEKKALTREFRVKQKAERKAFNERRKEKRRQWRMNRQAGNEKP